MNEKSCNPKSRAFDQLTLSSHEDLSPAIFFGRDPVDFTVYRRRKLEYERLIFFFQVMSIEQYPNLPTYHSFSVTKIINLCLNYGINCRSTK